MKKSLKYMFCFGLLLASLTPASARAQSPAVQLLIQKAQSLEGRGRNDLAAQTWQQILTTASPALPDGKEGALKQPDS